MASKEEHGPVTEDERAAALDELDGLEAEHKHRRTGSAVVVKRV